MDPYLQRYLTTPEDPELDLLDEIGHLCIRKAEMAEFPEDYGRIILSRAEFVVAWAWGGYSLAINGGVTEVVSCMEVEPLVEALREIGTMELAEAVLRMEADVEKTDRENAHLSREELCALYTELKFEGRWKVDDHLYYDEAGQLVPKLRAYILAHAAEYDLAPYADE